MMTKGVNDGGEGAVHLGCPLKGLGVGAALSERPSQSGEILDETAVEVGESHEAAKLRGRRRHWVVLKLVKLLVQWGNTGRAQQKSQRGYM